VSELMLAFLEKYREDVEDMGKNEESSDDEDL